VRVAVDDADPHPRRLPSLRLPRDLTRLVDVCARTRARVAPVTAAKRPQTGEPREHERGGERQDEAKPGCRTCSADGPRLAGWPEGRLNAL
jgi:hypothetical protein